MKKIFLISLLLFQCFFALPAKANVEEHNYSHENILEGKVDFVFGGKYSRHC